MNPLLAYLRSLRVNLTLRTCGDFAEMGGYALLLWVDWRVAFGVLALHSAGYMRGMAR